MVTPRPFQQQKLFRLAWAVRKTPACKKREAIRALLCGLKNLLEQQSNVQRPDV